MPYDRLHDNREHGRFCPQCGWDSVVDGYGRCLCGCTHTDGEAVDLMMRELRDLYRYRRCVPALLSILEDIAEGDCDYGDNCPTFGSRHYRCYSCKARKALKEYYEGE